MAELSNGATCPLCGLPLMPSLLECGADALTVAELTREITYLRETVARLRGSGFTGGGVDTDVGGGTDRAH